MSDGSSKESVFSRFKSSIRAEALALFASYIAVPITGFIAFESGLNDLLGWVCFFT